MVKKKVTFAVDDNVYDCFKQYCEKNTLVISDQIERLLLVDLRSKGIKIKNYPTLHSFFRVVQDITEKIIQKTEEIVEPNKETVEAPKKEIKPVVKEEIGRKIPLVGQRMHQDYHPKHIISKKPTPTIDQLRTRRRF